VKFQDMMISGGFFAGVLFFILFLYMFFGLTLYLGQSKMIFLPEKRLESAPDRIGLDYEKIRFKTHDGLRLFGWYMPIEQEKGVVLFFHGNAGNISHRLDSLALFHALGYSTFIFDYRGYGRSEGTPTEEGLYLDAEAAWQYLIEEKKVKPEDVILFGRSLGGALAAHISSLHAAGGCILESAFTSAKDMAASLYPMYPARFICRFNFNTLESVLKKKSPLLVVHSPADEIIPFSHGRKIFAAAAAPKTFLEITGDHNSGFLVSGANYENGLQRFLQSLH
jgi:hypothetical protein